MIATITSPILQIRDRALEKFSKLPKITVIIIQIFLVPKPRLLNPYLQCLLALMKCRYWSKCLCCLISSSLENKVLFPTLGDLALALMSLIHSFIHSNNIDSLASATPHQALSAVSKAEQLWSFQCGPPVDKAFRSLEKKIK